MISDRQPTSDFTSGVEDLPGDGERAGSSGTSGLGAVGSLTGEESSRCSMPLVKIGCWGSPEGSSVACWL